MDQSIDMRTLVMAIAQTLVTLGGVFGLMKFRLNEHHKTLYGNGRPGVVSEINSIRSDIRSLVENCKKTHSDESKTIREAAHSAAEVVAEATLKAAHEVAQEAVRASLRRSDEAKDAASILADRQSHDNT